MLHINCIFCSKPLVIEEHIIKCQEHSHEMSGFYEDNEITTFSFVIGEYCLLLGYKYPRTLISKCDPSGYNYQIIFSKSIVTAMPKSYDDAIKKINIILTYM